MRLRQQAFQLGEAVGCRTSDSSALISCLQAVEAEDLMAAQTLVRHQLNVVCLQGGWGGKSTAIASTLLPESRI